MPVKPELRSPNPISEYSLLPLQCPRFTVFAKIRSCPSSRTTTRQATESRWNTGHDAVTPSAAMRAKRRYDLSLIVRSGERPWCLWACLVRNGVLRCRRPESWNRRGPGWRSRRGPRSHHRRFPDRRQRHSRCKQTFEEARNITARRARQPAHALTVQQHLCLKRPRPRIGSKAGAAILSQQTPRLRAFQSAAPAPRREKPNSRICAHRKKSHVPFCPVLPCAGQ